MGFYADFMLILWWFSCWFYGDSMGIGRKFKGNSCSAYPSFWDLNFGTGDRFSDLMGVNCILW